MAEQYIAIRVHQVSKAFRLPHEKTTSIKSAIVNFYKRRSFERQQVLRDISFEIKKGEFFGIVGRNGSGKSTLLKLLAGIYTPDKGAVQVNGSLTPFIELGVGFNPELTGRENVFLNGALLGFSRKEMAAMYGDIVKFAELERFMDQKLKNYSSGMQVRLAFSIAVRAQSDVLLIDEVLAVGDAAFQQKCFDYFDRLKEERRTIVFVSHDMEAVKKYCNRAVLISDGEMIRLGDPQEIAEDYRQLNDTSIDAYTAAENATKQSDLTISLRDAQGRVKARFAYDQELTVRLTWPAHKTVKHAGIALYTSGGVNVFATNTFIDKTAKVKGHSIEYHVRLPLGEGRYYVMAGTFLDTKKDIVDFIVHGPEFSMSPEPVPSGEGLVRLTHKWE
ncbi:MAG TPA: ABC transporter ATP-binding protein [Candidatus Saccharimonadales bacterium]|nr:ABC transporter ATP-binding protein [Candidatus Saccharimonadales bacterium]